MTDKPAPLPKLLIVEDDPGLQRQLRWAYEGYQILPAGDRESAIALLRAEEPAVVTLDLGLPPDPDGTSEGFAVLEAILALKPDTKVIVASGHGAHESMLRAIAMGAWDFYQKPIDIDALGLIVARAFHVHALEAENRRLAARAESGNALGGIITGAPEMLKVTRTIERVAPADVSVMLLGASGTGKELLARGLHEASGRKGAFVAINCAAIPETLLESELFGHKRGAFTGAYEDHIGLFQRADGGTVFLDEIGETSPAFQVRLLRVLQEGEVRPVGGTRAVPVDVRVIAATHRDLEQRVREGLFREDLYYRIAGATFTVPPLRERVGDIEPIARRVVDEVGIELGRPGASLSDEAMACLMGYPWPGNIRELRNELARALALSDSERIEAQSLSLRVLHGQAGLTATASATPLPASGTLAERLDAIEAMVLRETLLRHRWNKTRAAKELGLSRVGLRGKMVRFGLEG